MVDKHELKRLFSKQLDKMFPDTETVPIVKGQVGITFIIQGAKVVTKIREREIDGD